MHDIKSVTEKNAPTSLAISMVIRIKWYGAERIAQYGRSRATLDATGHQKIFTHIALADAMVINFWRKKSSCGVVKLLFEATVQKARNGPSIQL